MGNSQGLPPPPSFSTLFTSKDSRAVAHAMEAIEEIPQERWPELRRVLFMYQREDWLQRAVARAEKTSGRRLRADAKRLLAELERFRDLYLVGDMLIKEAIWLLRSCAERQTADGRQRFAHYNTARRQIEVLGASPDGAKAMLRAMGARVSPGRRPASN